MLAPVVLFAIAAAGGLFLAIRRFTNQSLPIPVALLHGALAAAALVLLLVAVLGGAMPQGAKIALGLFVVAALGGFLLFSFHLRKRALPIPAVVIHALVAVGGFLTLVVAAARG